MSDNATPKNKKTSELHEQPTNELLKEYTEKLAALSEKAELLVKATEGQPKQPVSKPSWILEERTMQFVDLWKNLRPPARKLAQYVSSTIEHTRIDQLTQIELRLRLAEFENHMRFLEHMTESLEKSVR